MKTTSYNYLSPDGFAISFEDFSSPADAKSFLSKWINAFKIQGYYSSTNFGRIPLSDLADLCKLYEISE